MKEFKVGDRVAVYDEGLIALARVMEKYGGDHSPQNEGVIESIRDRTAIIIFDAGDAAPYLLSDCTHI